MSRIDRPAPRARRVPHAPLAAAVLSAFAGLCTAQAPQADDNRAYCERQQGAARVVCLRDLEKAMPSGAAPAATGGMSADGAAPRVVDGTHVDANTFKGFQTWRAAACDRCHGANQQGLVGPSLIASLKALSKEDFEKAVTEGRLDKGMPAFKENRTVMANLDPLYAYLKGRSDGTITQAHVQRIQ